MMPKLRTKGTSTYCSYRTLYLLQTIQTRKVGRYTNRIITICTEIRKRALQTYMFVKIYLVCNNFIRLRELIISVMP